jgi:hypothetical protein
MKLYSYIIVKDRGLAPNPFWGYCTLAVCTPNHMGVKPDKGDWIIGISPKKQGNKLVYSMQVNETLYFDKYFHDERYQQKKPDMNGPWEKRCGDNFYRQDEKGEWIQSANAFHNKEEDYKKDTKYPRVFVSTRFYYFGDNEVDLPIGFTKFVLDRQGCKRNYDPTINQAFVGWLEANYSLGVNGKPKDRVEACSGCL